MSSIAKETPLPSAVKALDQERMRRYRENLEFYRGTQWSEPARRGERRLTFNYARALVDKVASYLLADYSVQVAAEDAGDTAAAERAAVAERALRLVERENGLAQLDFETELDCAILGDAAYKVFWDATSTSVRVTAPDVQGLYAWRQPDDSTVVHAIASQYEVQSPGARSVQTVTEHWTSAAMELWHDLDRVESLENPYGFVPFVLFPNVREPKEAWGISDVAPVMDSSRELNRAFSQLSQILELSGNPVAVLEGVAGSQDIAVEPGAVWEVPERARAYLLDLLQGGGVALHRDYIDLVYRTLHDLGESPRTAFGHNPSGLSGVALNTELDPIARKVARKRLIRTSVYERRTTMILRLLRQFQGLEIEGIRPVVRWGPVLPVDRTRQAQDERALVQSGIRSRRTAAARLGEDDPESEWALVLEEREALAE